MQQLLQIPLLDRGFRITVTLLVLILTSRLLAPVEQPAWETVKARQVELGMEEIEGALGQGLVLGIFGGFRTVIADFLWIQMNQSWRQKERAKLNATLQLVTTLDPRAEFFWINGARMLAYDVPNWRIQQEGGYRVVPESRQQELDREQAEQAFVLLRRAQQYHPDNPKITMEFAQIYLNRLKDHAQAAEWFLKASKQDGAPFYAARIYAELLRRDGLDREAYEFYKQLFLDLPDDNAFAQKPVVLERIRELELELEIPIYERFFTLSRIRVGKSGTL